MGARFFEKHIASSISLALLGLIVFWGCLVSDAYCAQKQNIHDLFSVSFPSEVEGWACGRFGTILHGTEGGTKWTAQESGTRYTLSQIDFTDNSHGWAVGEEGTILHTSDGGKSWNKQNSPENIFLMGVCFIDADTGWAVGESTTILNTIDGGKTWKVQFRDEDYYLKKISFCDDKNGWAVGEYGYTYHTTDGGACWKKQDGYFGISMDTGRVEGGTFRFDVFAVDPMTAWVVGIDGYIRKTSDGGGSWQRVFRGGDIPGRQLFSIVAAKDCIIIGGSRSLLVSGDGGETFTKPVVIPPVTYGYIYSITPRGNAGFVAVGKQGWIYLADANGDTWTRVVNK